MTQVIAFDVNETLLDLRALDEPFATLFGSDNLRPQWFAQMLQLAFIGGLTGEYVDFTAAQRAALRMLAARLRRQISDDEVDEMVDRMRSLPPHPEVVGALRRLALTSLSVIALTNSVQDVAEAQLRNAGLEGFFDGALSADSVSALKPAAAPYRAVAERYDVAQAEVRLVAAHSWDVSGALAAGARAAFVARPGMVLSPIGPPPDIVGSDISDVVDQIIAVDLGGTGTQ